MAIRKIIVHNIFSLIAFYYVVVFGASQEANERLPKVTAWILLPNVTA